MLPPTLELPLFLGGGKACATDDDMEVDGEGEGPQPVGIGRHRGRDPEHHPSLRSGAMSKSISQTPLNAVVGIMEEDFGMRASGAAGSDEEDELDDYEL